MDTIALRLHGKNDLRLDRFPLPPLADDEILADVVTDSICMSSHKLAIQGQDHKRVPHDLDDKPVIVGHEFCGTILEVGKAYTGKYEPGMKYSVQPALNYPGRLLEAPGYSFQYIGGDATRIVIPREVMERDCLLTYDGDGFFKASLSEPVSCIIGAFNSQYHYEQGEYVHRMGIVDGGTMALLAGVGPMGLGAIDYTLHGPRRPRLLVVTDIDQSRLDRAASLFTPEHASSLGVKLLYVNTRDRDAVAALREANGGEGFDDVFVFAPVPALIEQASAIAGFNCCINFFAGPSKSDFTASLNFYDVHYSGVHIAGSSGGNTQDMRDALALMARGAIDPAVMITHVGGLDAAAETTLNLPSIPGGKKLIYTHKSLPLTALTDFEALGEKEPLFAELAAITKRHNGLWSPEAEQYLLRHAEDIETAAPAS
ncbi:MAG: zinc-binding dehydrogenase [Chitinivibrionales bacterium]|nr:zinc-binding dehydrogenase [Chitinivibrionales bacterium]